MRFIAGMTTNPPWLLSKLNRDAWQHELAREANAAGAAAVQFARENFLTGGTTATRTAVRSGRRLRSYGHAVAKRSDGVVLDYGPIRAAGGVVPIHVRVHEGFDQAGNRVDQFVIRPKNKPYGRFPLRVGGGLAKGGIVGWRTYTRERPVILRPRPTFPAVQSRLENELPERGSKAFQRLFGESA
jgi:hypothetical protein